MSKEKIADTIRDLLLDEDVKDDLYGRRILDELLIEATSDVQLSKQGSADDVFENIRSALLLFNVEGLLSMRHEGGGITTQKELALFELYETASKEIMKKINGRKRPHEV